MNKKLRMFFIFCMSSFVLNAARPIVYFDGRTIKKRLIQLISNEQECIKVAMYMFTDKDIAKKLIEARKRGVRIEPIVDHSTIHSQHGMADKLRDQGIPVMERETLPFHSTMHLKCWLFESTRLNNSYKHQPCVFTGSCNCTYNGAYRNDEMMALLFGKQVFDKSNESFKELKKKSKYVPKS